jgi:hypothetical protein
METNTGGVDRQGAMTGNSQTYNPVTHTHVKRHMSAERPMGGKTDGKPFAGVQGED